MYLYQQPESTTADHIYAEKDKQLVRMTIDTMRALVADLASQAQASADACASSMAAIELAMAGLTTTGEQAAAIAALQSGKADLSTVSTLQEEMAVHGHVSQYYRRPHRGYASCCTAYCQRSRIVALALRAADDALRSWHSARSHRAFKLEAV